MTNFIQLAQNISNFNDLALFICHLFVDGHFRTGHILYNQNLFDGHLISEFNSVCPETIPWLMTDVTKTSSVLWDTKDRTDNILQLIFFEPGNSLKEIDKYKNYLTSCDSFER